MLPKTRAYVKSYDGQTKWVYFLIEDVTYWKKINSALILKKNLIANLITINFLKGIVKS